MREAVINPIASDEPRCQRVVVFVRREQRGTRGMSRGCDPEIVFAHCVPLKLEVRIDNGVGLDQGSRIDWDLIEVPEGVFHLIPFSLSPAIQVCEGS